MLRDNPMLMMRALDYLGAAPPAGRVTDYGDAVVTRQADGTLRVDQADPMVGISVEVLAQCDGAAMPIDSDGCVWLAGDPAYRYRPVRFAPGLGGAPRIVVCERVEPT